MGLHVVSRRRISCSRYRLSGTIDLFFNVDLLFQSLNPRSTSSHLNDLFGNDED